MTINLENFIDQEVKVTYRIGAQEIGKVTLSYDGPYNFRYVFKCSLYSKTGEVFNTSSNYDIVNIELVNPIIAQTDPMKLDITQQIRIRSSSTYWHTVEDFHLDAGVDGFTLSAWSSSTGSITQEKRDKYICMNKEEALAVADAIYKLFSDKTK
jgi:hypothetical protein